jgi:hypothetical protein
MRLRPARRSARLSLTVTAFIGGVKGIDMEGIKAKIRGNGVDSSVEFSVEEVIARNPEKPWATMSEADREAVMKDYALSLFARQEGMTGDLQVSLEKGTFSNTQSGSV